MTPDQAPDPAAPRRLVGPVAVLIYHQDWLPTIRYEWEPLAAAAAAAGFDVVVTHWEALIEGKGEYRASECLVQRAGSDRLQHCEEALFLPRVVWTPWGTDAAAWDLYHALIATPGCVHSESSLLSELDGKLEFEQCLRAHEAVTGMPIPRPRTWLWSELPRSEGEATGSGPTDDLVIVKPSRGGKCQGIEIVPALVASHMAEEVAAGTRPPFVVQRLVSDLFLHHGRRWDIRLYVGATSLAPLCYHLEYQGVVRVAGVTAGVASGDPAAWLTGDSYRRAHDLPVVDLPLTQILDYLEHTYSAMPDFWSRLDSLVGQVFSSLATYSADRPDSCEGAFFFTGLDLIVERVDEQEYEILLLELNSHPGLLEPGDWWLQPVYRSWFEDLSTTNCVINSSTSVAGRPHA